MDVVLLAKGEESAKAGLEPKQEKPSTQPNLAHQEFRVHVRGRVKEYCFNILICECIVIYIFVAWTHGEALVCQNFGFIIINLIKSPNPVRIYVL